MLSFMFSCEYARAHARERADLRAHARDPDVRRAHFLAYKRFLMRAYGAFSIAKYRNKLLKFVEGKAPYK